MGRDRVKLHRNIPEGSKRSKICTTTLKHLNTNAKVWQNISTSQLQRQVRVLCKVHAGRCRKGRSQTHIHEKKQHKQAKQRCTKITSNMFTSKNKNIKKVCADECVLLKVSKLTAENEM